MVLFRDWVQEVQIWGWSWHEKWWTPHCWSALGCLQTRGCWQRWTGFQQPPGVASWQRGTCFGSPPKNLHPSPETRAGVNLCERKFFKRFQLFVDLKIKQIHTQHFDRLGSWPWWFWQGWLWCWPPLWPTGRTVGEPRGWRSWRTPGGRRCRELRCAWQRL